MARSIYTLLLIAALLGAPERALAGLQADTVLAEAQALLDRGRAEQALELIEPYLAKRKRSAQAYLIRSNAHFMLERREAGKADLDRALELDANLRQAWLNRAALLLSDQDYEGAYRAFSRAKELDPDAIDNELNLGATRLLQGRVDDALAFFDRYLQQQPGAESHYLVATNFAVAGHSALALEHLEQAIVADERTRLRARTDSNLRELHSQEAFLALMDRETFRPAPGSHHDGRTYDTRYETAQGILLGAVVDALRRLGIPFNPRIEVTDRWTLIWARENGDLRIKVTSTDDNERGVVELLAPPDAMSAEEFRSLGESLFSQVVAETRPKLSPSRPR